MNRKKGTGANYGEVLYNWGSLVPGIQNNP